MSPADVMVIGKSGQAIGVRLGARRAVGERLERDGQAFIVDATGLSAYPATPPPVPRGTLPPGGPLELLAAVGGRLVEWLEGPPHRRRRRRGRMMRA